MKTAKGSIIQQLLPAAIHPKYTGRLPITDPTNVFHYEVVFILVQTKRYPAQITAPIPAVIKLQLQSPARPATPNPIPLQSATLGFTPSTRGLWHVRSILRSYQIYMYWFRACVDIDRATDDANSGQAGNAVAQRLQEATVTIPFKTESLNLVRSKYFLIDLLRLPYINLLIYIQLDHQRSDRINRIKQNYNHRAAVIKVPMILMRNIQFNIKWKHLGGIQSFMRCEENTFHFIDICIINLV